MNGRRWLCSLDQKPRDLRAKGNLQDPLVWLSQNASLENWPSERGATKNEGWTSTLNRPLGNFYLVGFLTLAA